MRPHILLRAYLYIVLAGAPTNAPARAWLPHRAHGWHSPGMPCMGVGSRRRPHDAEPGAISMPRCCQWYAVVVDVVVIVIVVFIVAVPEHGDGV